MSARPVKHYNKWRIRWIDAGGKRRSATFDSHREAEVSLLRNQLEAEEIRRGIRESVQPDRTFAEIAVQWIDHRAAHKRSGKSDVSIINRHLRPVFGEYRLLEVTVARVDAFKTELLTRVGPKTVHNILTLLVAMLNYAVDLGWIAKAPRIRKPKIVHNPNDYRYLRTDGEIRRFLRSARAEGESVFTMYATAIYTGMRAGELAGLRWSCVNFDQRLITVQASYDGPTKAGDVRYVPILDALLPALRAWRLKHPGDLVFANAAGSMHGPSARIFQEVLHRVLASGGFATTCDRQGRTRRYLTFHGLRHTFASQWMMKGGDIFKLQRIGGWKSFEMVQRYAHLAPHAFEADWGRMGGGLPDGDVTGGTVPLRRVEEG
jgi:integrase